MEAGGFLAGLVRGLAGLSKPAGTIPRIVDLGKSAQGGLMRRCPEGGAIADIAFVSLVAASGGNLWCETEEAAVAGLMRGASPTARRRVFG
jgi:hypothetical protein